MNNICYITMTDGTVQTATYGSFMGDGPSVRDGDLVVIDSFKKVAVFNKGDWKSFSNSAPVTNKQADKEELTKLFAEISEILFSKTRY